MKTLVSKVDFFGIKVGQHVQILETIKGEGQVPTYHKCLVENYGEELGEVDWSDPYNPKVDVIKEGEPAIHYMYDFEMKEYDVEKIIDDGILFMAGTPTITYGRAFTDVLKHIAEDLDGVMPEELKDWRLCPSSFTGEFFKVVGDQGLTTDDAFSILNGKRTKKTMVKFVKAFYRLNRSEIEQGVNNWDTLKTVAGNSKAEDK